MNDSIDRDAVFDKIYSLPTVEPERDKGEWINYANGTYVCNQCGRKYGKSNYCPNCGSDMRGESDAL